MCVDDSVIPNTRACPFCKKEINPRSVEYISKGDKDEDYQPGAESKKEEEKEIKIDPIQLDFSSDEDLLKDIFEGVQLRKNLELDISESEDSTEKKKKGKKRRRKKSKSKGKVKEEIKKEVKTEIKKEIKKETKKKVKREERTRFDSSSSDDGLEEFLHNLMSSSIPSQNINFSESSEDVEIQERIRFNLSSKMERLFKDIERVKKNHPDDKCVVFSSFTMFLDLIQAQFYNMGWKHERYDGSMTTVERQYALDNFEAVPGNNILLCSIKSGGVGLNLTCANRVFLMEPWWNPAIDEQAIDRVHRIGQKKVVQVISYVVKDSIEEQIIKLQQFKKSLSDGALGIDTNETARKMSLNIEDLRILFSTNNTKDEDTNSSELRPRFGREEIMSF
eukprot:TRINITY_DN1431_c0_g4_i1.p1 TRINITY_DN1431_c0_g4~~TRINITY_DN1431_c0_g4_i1.p1  ORF type:complete len:391 (+),score=104.37 TRINITY_DN1431_c0_g4_i1:142-1314(+)